MKKLQNLSFVLKFYLLFLCVKIITIYYKFIGFNLNKPTKDILYLESFTIDGAGYNYRVKHWQDLLLQDELSVESLFIIEKAEDFFRETAAENLSQFLLKSILIRIKQIHYSRNFKTVVVRRNLLVYNQYGNHFMEKLLIAAHPNRILDFDDDIGAADSIGEQKSLFQKIMLTSDSQFYKSFKYYNRFIVGSNYLKALVLENLKSINEKYINVIPTCVHYTELPPKQYTLNTNELITFGWIGGNQNLPLLKSIIPALNELSKTKNICMHVIAGVSDYDFNATFPIVFKKFSLEREVEDLKQIEIGLMPLIDNKVSRGKCGFKLLQYMGLGIPGIATAITINKEIIEEGVNGWLVEPNEDWLPVLLKAVESINQIEYIGIEARKTVKKHYSFKANYLQYRKFISSSFKEL